MDVPSIQHPLPPLLHPTRGKRCPYRGGGGLGNSFTPSTHCKNTQFSITLPPQPLQHTRHTVMFNSWGNLINLLRNHKMHRYWAKNIFQTLFVSSTHSLSLSHSLSHTMDVGSRLKSGEYSLLALSTHIKYNAMKDQSNFLWRFYEFMWPARAILIFIDCICNV